MIPSAGTPIKIRDIISASIKSCNFEDELRKMLNVKYSFAVNSGTTAFYLILKTLKKLSGRSEIILPAYTAPSLILPIRKAGLKYRLVDISLDTFNMDSEKAAEAVIGNTLAVLCIHMFGIPVNMVNVRGTSDIFIIEDAASSFGTSTGDGFTGAFGDIGFISFNRGKNLSTVSGGLIMTDNDAFVRTIQEEIGQLPHPGFPVKLKIRMKALGLSFAVRPWFYSVCKQVLSGFKYTTLHTDFDSFQYTGFQGALGCSLLKRAKAIFDDRESKGKLLHDALNHIKGIRLPVMPEGCRVVFNQFPLLVKDAKKRTAVVEAVVRAGVEATTLYDRPIHKIYSRPDDKEYPNAEYMAERLVLIPTHHYLPAKSIEKIAGHIEKAVR